METTLLFKTTLILTFELSIAFCLCIYFLKAAKKAALSGKDFFGIHFTHAVNMNNELDLIPDPTRSIEYPRKMSKLVDKPEYKWKKAQRTHQIMQVITSLISSMIPVMFYLLHKHQVVLVLHQQH